MNLSGKLIKGTGSYEVKEIAPPSVVGNFIVNGGFDTDSDWTKGTGWTISGGVASCDGTQSANSNLWQAAGANITDGKTYKVTYTVSNYSAGKINAVPGGNVYAQSVLSNGTYTDIVFSDNYTNSFFYLQANADFVGSVDNVSIEEVPEGYPLMDKGMKYLECTAYGETGLLSDIAYGEWEFDVYKGGDNNALILNFISGNHLGSIDRYKFAMTGSESIKLRNGTTDILESSDGYFQYHVWYRIKITRTLDGEFTLYIKGGEFGLADWTLVDASQQGTNPVTNTTWIKSTYIAMDFDLGDRIANLIVKNLVRQ